MIKGTPSNRKFDYCICFGIPENWPRTLIIENSDEGICCENGWCIFFEEGVLDPGRTMGSLFDILDRDIELIG